MKVNEGKKRRFSLESALAQIGIHRKTRGNSGVFGTWPPHPHKKRHRGAFPSSQRPAKCYIIARNPKANFTNPLNARTDISRSKQTAVPGRRRRHAAWCLLAVWLAFPVPARAAKPAVSIAAPSAWVASLPFQRLTKPDDTNSGLSSRLLLRDVQINALTHETFHHEARQLLSPQGVQTGSQLSIDFDAARQSLLLHWARARAAPMLSTNWTWPRSKSSSRNAIWTITSSPANKRPS